MIQGVFDTKQEIEASSELVMGERGNFASKFCSSSSSLEALRTQLLFEIANDVSRDATQRLSNRVADLHGLETKLEGGSPIPCVDLPSL